MKIALIYNRNQRVALGERCQQILSSVWKIDISQFNLQEIQEVKGGFDLYLRLDDGDYTANIPFFLKPSAWWISDTHLPKAYKKIEAQAGHYDFVFCAQKEGAEKLTRKIGKDVYWIPWAADYFLKDFMFPEERVKKWDICFIGTFGKHSLRKVFLEELKVNYNNIFIGRTHYSQIFDYYSRSKIVVNYSINNDINARIFEGMASGALVITHRIVDNGFDDLFVEGKHLVVFDDIFKDMKDKINYYLNHVDQRIEIAKNGFMYVKNKHTFYNRLVEMFKIMGYDLNVY